MQIQSAWRLEQTRSTSSQARLPVLTTHTVLPGNLWFLFPRTYLFKNKHPTHRNTQEQWYGLYTIHQLSHFLHTADGEKRAPRQWRQQTLLLPPPFLLVRLVPVPLSLSLSLCVCVSLSRRKEGRAREVETNASRNEQGVAGGRT